MAKNITESIQLLRDSYIKEKLAENYYEINCGLCEDFAETIESEFWDALMISNDHFITEREGSDGWNGDKYDIWDEYWLKEYNSLPPVPFSVTDLTEKILGYHCWIYYQNKHYDAECSEGVENFFELPFFKRYLELEKSKNKNELYCTEGMKFR